MTREELKSDIAFEIKGYRKCLTVKAKVDAYNRIKRLAEELAYESVQDSGSFYWTEDDEAVKTLKRNSSNMKVRQMMK
jgi:hypothetical protein